MIFPIGDDNSDRTATPLVNYLLIAINVLVFVLLQGGGSNEKFTYAYSTVPQEIVTGTDIDRPVSIQDAAGSEIGRIDLQPTPPSVYITLLTSMFMHGGWMHLFGNMLFLWIFGDNIEDRLGHGRYLVFYLVCGLLASLTHVFTSVAFAGDNRLSLLIPSLGASGAISGVLGGYLLLFPRRQVRVFILRMLTTVPAIVAIGLWFVLQLVESFGMLSSGPQSGGGVAYAAHIGGFIAGLILIKLFAAGRGPSASPAV
ncbi:MAG TPA: rhomboid family intramembrane serine protease [Pyrinomonadaceae bacterium]|jgi:membrane associated rhomboid family serine protease